MRIICPGCDAQYEVPDEVIPDDGRDVQCSNCGTTWTFGPPERAGTPHGEGNEDQPSRPSDNDASEDDTLSAALPRRELDPKVASILRAEAERESAARAADVRPEPLEVQPDLGLTEAPRPPSGPEDRATAKVEPPTDQPAPVPPAPAQDGNMSVAAATAAVSRRELLPDIEEINSTLRSSGDRELPGDSREPDAQGRVRRSRGFGLGVLLAVLVFVAVLLVYQFAPEIAEAVPQADPWLSSFVTWVDEMRLGLDTKVRQVLDWLDAQAAASGE